MSNILNPNPVKGERHYGFSLKVFKKHPSLIPLIAALGFAASMAIAQSTLGFRKTDVIVNRRRELPPWERVNLNNPSKQKFLIIRQDYTADPRLVELKKAD